VSLSLIVGNLGSWALQTLLLIAVTGAVLALPGVTDPRLRLRLRTWHGILGAAAEGVSRASSRWTHA
jgi:hypothetical protein